MKSNNSNLHFYRSESRGVGQIPPPPWDTTGYGQQAASTHPTGVHSCSVIFPVAIWMAQLKILGTCFGFVKTNLKFTKVLLHKRKAFLCRDHKGA